jgi:hypothetical protein
VAGELFRWLLGACPADGVACLETTAGGPFGPWSDGGAAAAGRDVVPPESLTAGWEFCGFAELTETLGAATFESTFAATCVPVEPVPALALDEPAGVDADVETLACEVLTPACVEACVDAGGAETLVDAEAAGGAVCAVAETDTDAAGVLADTFMLAAGAGVADVLAGTATETFGVAGAAGKPSAWAGSAKDKHHSVPTPRPISNRRKLCFRAISVFSLVGLRKLQTCRVARTRARGIANMVRRRRSTLPNVIVLGRRGDREALRYPGCARRSGRVAEGGALLRR